MVGVSAGLIPFLEHDDANRALMGSNMQRQAVPLLVTEPPIVGTGMEREVAVNSGLIVRAAKKGTVTYVDAESIEVAPASGSGTVDTYKLRKYVGLNERTCQNQKPIVQLGQKVEKGEVHRRRCFATYKGELALAATFSSASCRGMAYNFEDAIIISEELVEGTTSTPRFTSKSTTSKFRDTKLGREEFTRDIPNVSERPLRNLDESGIVQDRNVRSPGRYSRRQGFAQEQDRTDA